MTPYYEDADCTIYHGDALELINDGALDGTSIDAIITDPPYASGSRSEASRSSSGSMLRGEHAGNVRLSTPIDLDQMTTTGFVWLMRSTTLALVPHLVDGGSMLCFIDWRQWPQLVGAIETTNLRIQNMVVWDKQNMGLGNGFRNQHELIVHASKGVPLVYNKSVPNVIKDKRVDPRKIGHPSPKPIGLLSEMIGVVTDVGGVIVDPFAGSGSLLIAARSLGRRSIGFEKSIEHCETAAKRLNAERSLFDGVA